MSNALIIPSHLDGFNLRVLLDFLVRYSGDGHFDEAWIVHETDEEIKNTKKLLASLADPRLRVLKNSGAGIMGCINEALQNSEASGFVVIPGDDFPIVFSLKDFFDLLQSGCVFVSGTRYAHGGVRVGGNIVGNLLSVLCAKLVGKFSRRGYTDLTTGVKGFNRKYFDALSREVPLSAGWEFGFHMSLNSESIPGGVGEVAIRSVDRIFGGESSFRLLISIKKYGQVAVKYICSFLSSPSGGGSTVLVRKIKFEE